MARAVPVRLRPSAPFIDLARKNLPGISGYAKPGAGPALAFAAFAPVGHPAATIDPTHLWAGSIMNEMLKSGSPIQFPRRQDWSQPGHSGSKSQRQQMLRQGHSRYPAGLFTLNDCCRGYRCPAFLRMQGLLRSKSVFSLDLKPC